MRPDETPLRIFGRIGLLSFGGPAAQIALLNIRDRRQETGRFGATGDELAALALLADFYMSFWLAQSGDLFRKARTELHRIRREQEVRERAA